MGEKSSNPERRKILVLIGGAAAAAAAIAAGVGFLRASAPTPTPTPTPTPRPTQTPTPTAPRIQLLVKRIPKVPLDPGSPEWEAVPEISVDLLPQTMAYPTNPRPAVARLSVRAAHDGELVGFRLEWKDPKPDTDALDVNRFPDQCAVLMLSSRTPQEVLGSAWMMGTPEWPATILSWRADWQVDVDKGYQEVEDLYPNMAVDGYPPYAGTVIDLAKPARMRQMPSEALKWLPGMVVGNIMSEIERTSPVAKLVGKGPGTLNPLKTQDALGKGVYSGGAWRVVVAKRLGASDKDLGELSLSPGEPFYAAFAVWEGGSGERGGRKGISDLLLAGLES